MQLRFRQEEYHAHGDQLHLGLQHITITQTLTNIAGAISVSVSNTGVVTPEAAYVHYCAKETVNGVDATVSISKISFP